MAMILLGLGDRDTKRWHVCLSCLISEIQALNDKRVNEILDKFKVEVGTKREDGHSGLGLEFPNDYKVPQEMI